ncbi:hypothetical protein EW145_g510 [Phellinidium pouzarii]|uniref:RING-type domain-containing protein n=1 Tax=Phellinidium pouzarii TaxID=167371 RepID=A0A4S4LIM0_9AGAM|nr:hypothetical protein EW145_g510 [Phellinidium pouzarii]
MSKIMNSTRQGGASHSLTLKRILSGEEFIFSHAGTSQYSQGGLSSSACGLASLNCVRYLLGCEREGTIGDALVTLMLRRETMEEIMSVCALWTSNAHLEVDEIYKTPLFEVSLKLLLTDYYWKAGESKFEDVLCQLNNPAGVPNTHRSRAVVITRPPEIITCLKIAHPAKDLYVIFDSHPRPAHPDGAAFIFNTSRKRAARYLAALLPVDTLLLGPNSGFQWQAELLAHASGHFFEHAHRDMRMTPDALHALHEANCAVLRFKAQESEVKSQCALLTSENERLRREVDYMEEQIEQAKFNREMCAAEQQELTELREFKMQKENEKDGFVARPPTITRPPLASSSRREYVDSNQKDMVFMPGSSILTFGDNSGKSSSSAHSVGQFPEGTTLTTKLSQNELIACGDVIDADVKGKGKMSDIDAALRIQLKYQEEDAVLSAQMLFLQATSIQETFDCSICMDKLPLDCVARVDNCQHMFCRECMRQYISSKLDERKFPISCPCCTAHNRLEKMGMISESLVQQVGVSDKSYTIFVELQMANFSTQLQCKRSAFVDKREYDEMKILACPFPKCCYLWCKDCQQEIPLGSDGPPHSCDGSAELQHLMDRRGWKHCPGCRTPTEKIDGCNHMTCCSPNCNTMALQIPIDRAYLNLLSNLRREKSTLSSETILAAICHYLVHLPATQPTTTPLTASVVASPLWKPLSLESALAIGSTFRSAVQLKRTILEAEKEGLFGRSASGELGRWTRDILAGLKDGDSLLNLAVSGGILAGLKDQDNYKNNERTTRAVEEVVVVSHAEITAVMSTQADPWESEFRQVNDRINASLCIEIVQKAFLSGSFLRSAQQSTHTNDAGVIFISPQSSLQTDVENVASSDSFTHVALICRLLARVIGMLCDSPIRTQRQKDAWMTLTDVVHALASLTRRVEDDWLLTPLSAISSEKQIGMHSLISITKDRKEDLILYLNTGANSRSVAEMLWTVLKAQLFSMLVLHQAVLEALLFLRPIAYSSTSSPPSLFSSSDLCKSILQALSSLSFVIASFGGIMAGQHDGRGFPELKKVFYMAVDILSSDTQKSELFVKDLIRSVDPSSTAFIFAGAPLGHPFVNAKRAFVLSCVEQFIPILSDSCIETHVLPLCEPHLENSAHREIYESAHSVMLSIFAAHAERGSSEAPMQSQKRDAKGESVDRGDQQVDLGLSRRLVPGYVKSLLRNAKEGRLTTMQFRLAYAALVRSTSTGRRSRPSHTSASTSKTSSTSLTKFNTYWHWKNKVVGPATQEEEIYVGDPALTWFCVQALLDALAESACLPSTSREGVLKAAERSGAHVGDGESNDRITAERMRLGLALVSLVSNVGLGLLPRVLQEVYNVIIGEVDVRRRRMLVEAVFEEITERVGSAEKEFAMQWWYECPGSSPIIRGDMHTTYDGTKLRLTGYQHARTQPSMRYTIYPLQLTEDDRHRLGTEPEFMPRPNIDKRFSTDFKLPIDQTIKYIRLLENNKCLLVIDDIRRGLFVYLEDMNILEGAITRGSSKKNLNREKIGHDILTAFDERKRMFVVCGVDMQKQSHAIQLHCFVFDEKYTLLQGQGSALNLTAWFNLADAPKFINILFIPGSDDVALVEVSRSGCHGISIPSEVFQEHDADENRRTTHNSLVDYHADVWTRFPVAPAIRRQTVTYSELLKEKQLIFKFERSTKRPTALLLSSIHILSEEFSGVISGLRAEKSWANVSSYKVGEWMVDIFCLIPIHIAIALDNRFIPLKDGVWAPDSEKALLGADVGQIADSLSFGWYESNFHSYLPTKPVEVVSSMGEQSVGKSFALNHLADTSFAGSAMRTTEGVWMSVTPTDKAVIVVLDFEGYSKITVEWMYLIRILGVHSIERSAQEDNLLVLFNAAISNLVLFRNNFTLSKDITDLFQSFQASASVLDPEANPTLFQSTQVIIIKDVVDSDRDEVTKEFQFKLQKIVHDEQASNFISRLYRGRLDIIPWPVIESRQFYTLFQL